MSGAPRRTSPRLRGACRWSSPFLAVTLLAAASLGSSGTPSCGGVLCNASGAACVTVQVALNGSISSQTLWVNSTSGFQYLPLSATQAQPFPTVLSVAARSAAPFNAATFPGGNIAGGPATGRCMTAYYCVRLIVSSDGSVAVNATDDTFAVSHNETTDVYSVGTRGCRGLPLGTTSPCLGPALLAPMLAGTDPNIAYLNINLSSTAFTLATDPCNGASRCNCSTQTTGSADISCPGWISIPFRGAVDARYAPAERAVTVRAGGWCGGVQPSPNVTRIALSGVIVSPSGTGTPTSSATPSTTRSSTQTSSPSRTQQPTSSATPTPSQGRTPSGTATATLSPTPTVTPSTTQSRSGTPTTSQAGTRSATSSGTQTQSATGLPTCSQTGTASITQSFTGSVTTTPSATPTASPTGTPSASGSRTQSVSPSQGFSGTHSVTPSQTQTSSVTPSQTQTPSRTPSQGASLTATPSISPTLTRTPSATQTPTLSATSTLTPSQTTSASGSRSQAMSPSQSSTASAAATSSASSSASQSGSASEGPTSSSSQATTRSATLSPSGATTGSRTGTGTPTGQGTGSGSDSASQAPTASATATPSPTASPSESASPSLSGSPSQGATLSQSATPSPTPSVSRNPYELEVFPAATPIAISDSLAPVSIGLVLSRCPAASTVGGVSVAVACVVGPPVFTAVSSPVSPVLPCDPAAAAPLPLALSVAIEVAFGVDAGCTATLTCSASDAATRGPLATRALPLAISPTAWPLWEDAILVTPAGLMRSSRLGEVRNASDALLSATSAHGRRLVAATADPPAILHAARAVWGGEPLPNTSAAEATAGSVFQVSLTGLSTLVLRSPAAAFPAGTTALLGAAGCAIGAVSADGRWLVLTTPAASAVCSGAAGTDCGYVPLTVNTTPAVQYAQRAGRNASDASADASGSLIPPGTRGAALTCPPFCPGAVSSPAVVPFAPTVDAPFVLASLPAPGSGKLTQPLVSAAEKLTVSSMGVYYTTACSSTGVYTDPALGACANASDPASYGCAYGSGDYCDSCPTGALCPGGNREL